MGARYRKNTITMLLHLSNAVAQIYASSIDFTNEPKISLMNNVAPEKKKKKTFAVDQENYRVAFILKISTVA